MFKINQTKERNMSYVYDDQGNLKNNCMTVTPTSEPRNIRGLRNDANWSIEAVNHDIKNNINHNVSCVFWTKKEALNFLKTGVHNCSVTNKPLYQIK
jgi:phosphopantetheine adenylyltransferase